MKTMTTFEDILQTLPTLDKAQRKLLQDRLRVLGGIDPTERASHEPKPDDGRLNSDLVEERFALDALMSAMVDRGFPRVPSKVLMGLKEFKKFKEESLPQINKYLDIHGIETRSVRFAVIRFGVSLLMVKADQWHEGPPVTARLLMAQFDRIPGMINKEFPGYAESGLLSKVVGREHEGDKKV